MLAEVVDAIPYRVEVPRGYAMYAEGVGEHLRCGRSGRGCTTCAGDAGGYAARAGGARCYTTCANGGGGLATCVSEVGGPFARWLSVAEGLCWSFVVVELVNQW